MHQSIIQDNFRHHYRLHQPGDTPAPAILQPKQFWDPVLTKSFVRHLRVPAGYWRQVLTRFPAAPYGPNATIEGRVSQLLLQRKLHLYPVRHLDLRHGQARGTYPALPGGLGVVYQLAPASVLLVNPSAKIRRFNNNKAASAFLDSLPLTEAQLRDLGQLIEPPIRTTLRVRLLESVSQALVDGRIVVLVREQGVTPPPPSEDATATVVQSKPASLGPHEENEVVELKNDKEIQKAEIEKLIKSDIPADRQQAIDKTIKHFNINANDIKSVNYDPSLVGDGQASFDGVIRIGPDAFKSVSWLGSTLAHEIEVHFQLQAKNGNWWTDEQGTAIQEVQAYDYELANAERFGLTTEEIESVRSYRVPYYDELNAENKIRVSKGVYDTYTP